MHSPAKLKKIATPLSLVAIFVVVFLLLRPVFSGHVILPQSLPIGPFEIHFYGLILAAAILAARWLALRRASEYGLSTAQADKFIFIVMAAGLVGARLYHVGSDWKYYLQEPGQIVAIWHGGLSIYGALGGGVIALVVLASRKIGVARKIDWKRFVSFLNWLTFSILIGQMIGRFGNLFNYEAFGVPTNLLWRMYVPPQFRPGTWVFDSYFHPWFLYEVLANLLIFGILWRWKRNSADLFLWYLLLYNIARMLLEFLRIDSTFIGPVRLNVVSSGVLAIVAAGILLYRLKNKSSGTEQSQVS